MKIFCLSIFNENYELFKKMNLIPVGLGDSIFDVDWLNDKGLYNIANKNKHFGEYTFHYHLWKNNIIDQNCNSWIGFCTYRRFWINQNIKENINLANLKNSILKKPDTSWINFDVVLVKPLIFKKIRNIKLIKKNIFEVLKKPTVLYKNTSLKDQFNIFHGSFFLKKALNLLDRDNRIGFNDYLEGYELNTYNLFICRNSKILFQYYEEIFPWLFECEKIFGLSSLSGYEKIRIYGFLAERYMPYWFKKNFKTIEWPITFFDTQKIS